MSFYSDKHSQFWRTFLIAVDTEPRGPQEIEGASGLKHRVLEVGIDDPSQRLVVISAESDPRTAAMAHTDIQAALPGIKVVTVRPIAFDLSHIAKLLELGFGKSEFTHLDVVQYNEKNKEPKKVQENHEPFIKPMLSALLHGRLSIPAQIYEAVMQLTRVKFEITKEIAKGDGTKDYEYRIDFSDLVKLDVAAGDKAFGLCPLELYQFDENQAEIFQRGKDFDGAKDILNKKNIMQYFFPPIDHLALGLSDRKAVPIGELIKKIEMAPGLGHPLRKPDLIPSKSVNPMETIQQLKDAGYYVEGTINLELTDKALTARNEIKFMPREGLLARIMSRFGINFDVSRWFNNVNVNVANQQAISSFPTAPCDENGPPSTLPPLETK